MWHFAIKCIAVKFAEPCMSSHFSESRDPSHVRRPCVQNVPGKIGEASPTGYTHGKATQRSTEEQMMWSHFRFGLAPPWCESGPFGLRTPRKITLGCPGVQSADLSRHQVFRDLQGLLTPRPSQEESEKKSTMVNFSIHWQNTGESDLPYLRRCVSTSSSVRIN